MGFSQTEIITVKAQINSPVALECSWNDFSSIFSVRWLLEYSPLLPSGTEVVYIDNGRFLYLDPYTEGRYQCVISFMRRTWRQPIINLVSDTMLGDLIIYKPFNNLTKVYPGDKVIDYFVAAYGSRTSSVDRLITVCAINNSRITSATYRYRYEYNVPSSIQKSETLMIHCRSTAGGMLTINDFIHLSVISKL